MATANELTQQYLSDDQLQAMGPALLPLVLALESVARRAPDESVAGMAAALANYFRTPDAL